MLNFTVGPVMMNETIKKIGGDDIPYFRTPEFSNIMLENEVLLKKFFKAPKDARILIITGSGTSAMDAIVLNTITKKDKVLIINGGSFGNRFCEICQTYDLNYTEIKCDYGKTLKRDDLYKYDNKEYNYLLVNMDETSTGVLYDINMISEFCQKNKIHLIVDSISSFLCDPFDMEKLCVDAVLTGSQKALALAPGLSIICITKTILDKIQSNNIKSYYLNLYRYIKDGERGQTPFTPAVGTILELNARLKMIDKNGGVDEEIKKTAKIANYFRTSIKNLPLSLFADTMSNAVTSLSPTNKSVSAYKIFEILKNEYNIFVCPNGGTLKDKVFRVGHIGEISYKDIDILVSALNDLVKRNIL